jgi:Zn-dependent peptidase ImmA (M78 family)
MEADRFAGAFLMPRVAFGKDFWASGSVDWANLFDLKRRWGVSLQAILVRAHELGLLDTASYRQAFREVARRGWRSADPEEPTAEEPELFAGAVAHAAKETGKTGLAIAAELHMKPRLFSAITGMTVVEASDGISSISDYVRRRGAIG